MAVLYRNDVSAIVEVEFDAQPHYAWAGKVAMYEIDPQTCELTLDGQSFNLCDKDPAKVLQAMRRHLWSSHDSEMRDEAHVECADDYQEAAE